MKKKEAVEPEEKDRRLFLERVGVPFCSYSKGMVTIKCLMWGEPRVYEAFKEANSYYDLTQWGQGLHHHIMVAVDWCRFTDFGSSMKC